VIYYKVIDLAGKQCELLTVRDDPVTLREFGWKDPLPSYVTAAPVLWKFWLTRKGNENDRDDPH
jgi:hypothetical protein